MASTTPPFSLQPVTYADIDALSKLCAEAFVTDKHTQVKQLGKKPFDMEEITREGLESNLGSEKFVYKKVVDNDTGEIAGYAGWVFCGIDTDKVPRSDPGKPETQPGREDKISGGDDHEEVVGDEDNKAGDDSIARLMAMEDEDMDHWQNVFMPPGTSCMVVVGLIVSSKFQSQGAGGVLLKWGGEVADKLGVFTWVHSSEAAWKTYERHGFEVTGVLDIDLDAWAPTQPVGEKGATWGHYVCRYMKRLPQDIK